MNAEPFKYIVTAIVLAVGFSIPLQSVNAQDADTDAQLDELFTELRDAEDELAAARIENQIRQAWSRSGSAAMDLLLRRGEDALNAGDPAEALDHFSALVDHAPDFTEAYHGRATAYFMLEMPGPALDDLREVLVREPRHFSALRGFAIMLEELGRPREALQVLHQIRDIHPMATDIETSITRLEMQLEGQAI